jgi:structural maintenance of chromosome 2
VEVPIKKLEHEVQALVKERQVMLPLRRISRDGLFGQAGSQYDFSGLDIGQLKNRARQLEEQQRGMKKSGRR